MAHQFNDEDRRRLRLYYESLTPEQRRARGAHLVTPEARKKISERNRQRHKDNPNDLFYLNTPEAIAARAAVMVGRPQTKPGLRAGPDHWEASTGVLRSPDGRLWPYTNRTHFVREHPELFEPEDVVWRSFSKNQKKAKIVCRAVTGLSALYCDSARASSWHGWTRADIG